ETASVWRRVQLPQAWRAAGLGCRSHLLLDVVPRLGYCPDLLGVLVGDLHLVLLLERHDQLDEVQRVRVEILDERRLRRHLVRLGAELADDDRLEPVEAEICHQWYFLLWREPV